MLIGQEPLKERVLGLIDSNSLPHTLILIGPSGQGKKTFAKWVAGMMEADLFTPDDLKIDSIREIQSDARTLSTKKVYLLADAENMTVQAQNALLKLAEEPPSNAYIIITVESTDVLLQTILSRSVSLRLGGYTRDELKVFTSDVELMALARNPGTIKYYLSFNYKDLISHAYKVVDNISRISAVNAFNILKHVDKNHYDTFIKMVIHAYGVRMKENPEKQYAQQLQTIHQTKNMLERHKSVAKLPALEMMFVNLREVAINELL